MDKQERTLWLLARLDDLRPRIRFRHLGEADRQWYLGQASVYEKWLASLGPLELTPEERQRYAAVLEDIE